MKRHLSPALLMSLAMMSAIWYNVSGQKFELTPFAGYQSSAKIKLTGGTYRICDGINYGAAFSIAFNESYRMELSLSRNPSTMTYTAEGSTGDPVDLNVSHISLGGVVEFGAGNTLVPFARIAIGGSYYNSPNGAVSKENVLHFSLSGGTRFFLNRHLGLRIKTTLLLPVFYDGSSYFDDTPVSTGDAVKAKLKGIQGDLTGGVFFRF